MSRSLTNLLSVVFTSLLVVSQFLTPLAVFAEEIESNEPTEITETESQATTTTGDAGAISTSEIDVNHTESNPPGEITVSDCSIAGTLGCPVNTSNEAEVTDNDNAATSTSGNNAVTNELGSAEIESGDASAITIATNQLNTTTIIASPSAEATSSAESSEIYIENSAELETTNTSDASSGTNTASGNKSDADITTGDASAAVSVANLVNTNVIGTDAQFLVINITQDEHGNINLLEVWKALQGDGLEQVGEGSSEAINVGLSNTATVSATAVASALTGDNQANENGGDVTINSGDAFASASLLNLINTNLIGSKFLFVVINIFNSLTGDIIVPNTDVFASASSNLNSGNMPQTQLFINNDGTISNSALSAMSDSGNNEELNNLGDESIETGTAYSQATSTNFMNTVLTGANWFQLLLNNFGLWNGEVLGWNAPDSSQVASASASTTLGLTDSLPGIHASDLESEMQSSLMIENQAESTYQVSATAKTGGNQANFNSGSVSIKTGVSVALANVFQMINTTIIGSKFFFPIINIFNTWNGNLTFAYPDLHISLTGNTNEVSLGGEMNYLVSYTNQGYEEASDGSITVQLPSEVSYKSNSLNITPQISGQNLVFTLGSIPSGGSGSFLITVTVNPASTIQAKANDSLLTRIKEVIVPKAQASSHDHQFTVTATILTSDAEKDPNNNTDSVVTTVVVPEISETTSGENSASQISGTPQLTIKNKHNVGSFVYQKDTITFTTEVKNTGTATVQNAQVIQFIKSAAGKVTAKVTLPIGVIPAGATKKLSYGLKVPSNLEAGQYISESIAAGKSEVDGSSVVSPVVATSFTVRALSTGLVDQAKASQGFSPEELGEVLGDTTEAIAEGGARSDNKPLLLLFSLVLLAAIKLLRRRHETVTAAIS